MMRRPTLTLLLTSLGTLASCTMGADTPGDAYTMADSAGVRIVESIMPFWADAPLSIDPEPLLRIGSEEEGPERFGVVFRGILLEDRRIAVAELTSREIRVFDWDGVHQRTFGGAGDGPGEFRLPSGLFDFLGDSIAVYDQRPRRMTIFALSGGTHRTVVNQMEGNFLAFGVMDDGGALFFNPGRGFRPDLEPGLQWDTTDVVLTDPVEGSAAMIARLASRQQVILPDGNTTFLAPAHGSIQAVAGQGFYWATTDRYEIGFYDRQGELRRILRRPVEPLAVEPSMIDEYIEANLERVRRTEGEAAVPRYRRSYEEGTYGEQVPLFGTSFVDREQRLWVSGPRWPALSGSPWTWSVFSSEGVWLNDVEAPEGVLIVDAGADRVLGVWQDEFDVPHIQLHRLTR